MTDKFSVSLYKGCTECGDKLVCNGKCFHFIQLPMKALEEHDRAIEQAAEKRGYERALDELLSWCDSKSDQIHNVPIISGEVARKIESLRKPVEGD